MSGILGRGLVGGLLPAVFEPEALEGKVAIMFVIKLLAGLAELLVELDAISVVEVI